MQTNEVLDRYLDEQDAAAERPPMVTIRFPFPSGEYIEFVIVGSDYVAVYQDDDGKRRLVTTEDSLPDAIQHARLSWGRLPDFEVEVSE